MSLVRTGPPTKSYGTSLSSGISGAGFGFVTEQMGLKRDRHRVPVRRPDASASISIHAGRETRHGSRAKTDMYDQLSTPIPTTISVKITVAAIWLHLDLGYPTSGSNGSSGMVMIRSLVKESPPTKLCIRRAGSHAPHRRGRAICNIKAAGAIRFK